MNLNYPKPYINDQTLAILLGGSNDRRYSWVKRALKSGDLVRLRRGVYLIRKKEKEPLDAFEIAQKLYGPSYISFESALAYHGWIPEAVYVTTSTTPKRSTYFQTSLGAFTYKHTPLEQFFIGVDRIETGDSIFLMASPWKALCDHYYVYRKPWATLADVQEDLRIEAVSLKNEPQDVLIEIAQYYDSPRVQKFAHMVLETLKWQM